MKTKDFSMPVVDSRPLMGLGWSEKLIGGHSPYALTVDFGQDGPAVNEKEMSVTFPFASGVRRDSVGDLLEIGGIDTSRHRQNPVCLFDHGKAVAIPIALAEDPSTKQYTVVKDEVGKVATCKAFFYQSHKDIEHARFCEQVFDMVAKRYIRAGSLGYVTLEGYPLAADPHKGVPQGMHLKKVLLLEASIVVMPANADTVLKMLSLPDVCGKPMSPILVKSLMGCGVKKKATLSWGTQGGPKPAESGHALAEHAVTHLTLPHRIGEVVVGTSAKAVQPENVETKSSDTPVTGLRFRPGDKLTISAEYGADGVKEPVPVIYDRPNPGIRRGRDEHIVQATDGSGRSWSHVPSNHLLGAVEEGKSADTPVRERRHRVGNHITTSPRYQQWGPAGRTVTHVGNDVVVFTHDGVHHSAHTSNVSEPIHPEEKSWHRPGDRVIVHLGHDDEGSPRSAIGRVHHGGVHDDGLTVSYRDHSGMDRTDTVPHERIGANLSRMQEADIMEGLGAHPHQLVRTRHESPPADHSPIEQLPDPGTGHTGPGIPFIGDPPTIPGGGPHRKTLAELRRKYLGKANMDPLGREPYNHFEPGARIRRTHSPLELTTGQRNRRTYEATVTGHPLRVGDSFHGLTVYGENDQLHGNVPHRDDEGREWLSPRHELERIHEVEEDEPDPPDAPHEFDQKSAGRELSTPGSGGKYSTDQHPHDEPLPADFWDGIDDFGDTGLPFDQPDEAEIAEIESMPLGEVEHKRAAGMPSDPVSSNPTRTTVRRTPTPPRHRNYDPPRASEQFGEHNEHAHPGETPEETDRRLRGEWEEGKSYKKTLAELRRKYLGKGETEESDYDTDFRMNLPDGKAAPAPAAGMSGHFRDTDGTVRPMTMHQPHYPPPPESTQREYDHPHHMVRYDDPEYGLTYAAIGHAQLTGPPPPEDADDESELDEEQKAYQGEPDENERRLRQQETEENDEITSRSGIDLLEVRELDRRQRGRRDAAANRKKT